MNPLPPEPIITKGKSIAALIAAALALASNPIERTETGRTK